MDDRVYRPSSDAISPSNDHHFQTKTIWGFPPLVAKNDWFISWKILAIKWMMWLGVPPWLWKPPYEFSDVSLVKIWQSPMVPRKKKITCLGIWHEAEAGALPNRQQALLGIWSQGAPTKSHGEPTKIWLPTGNMMTNHDQHRPTIKLMVFPLSCHPIRYKNPGGLASKAAWETPSMRFFMSTLARWAHHGRKNFVGESISDPLVNSPFGKFPTGFHTSPSGWELQKEFPTATLGF